MVLEAEPRRPDLVAAFQGGSSAPTTLSSLMKLHAEHLSGLQHHKSSVDLVAMLMLLSRLGLSKRDCLHLNTSCSAVTSMWACCKAWMTASRLLCHATVM